MSAEQLLREGKLDEALSALQDDVRKDPANAKLRTFLFQILCVLGQWDRALNQLNVSAELDPIGLAMAQMYREALHCEVFRAEVFAGKRSPLIFGEPAAWVGQLVEALRHDGEGNHQAAQEMRDQALEAAPATSGSIDDTSFEWIADADARLGPVVEAVFNGQYYWVPFNNIRQIMIEEPSDLRDMVWVPCQFIWSNGGESVGVIPTRYPGSELSDDPLIRLARKTDWIESPGGAMMGLGQRLLAVDSGDHSLLDVRRITLITNGENQVGMSQTTEGETLHG